MTTKLQLNRDALMRLIISHIERKIKSYRVMSTDSLPRAELINTIYEFVQSVRIVFENDSITDFPNLLDCRLLNQPENLSLDIATL